MRGKIQICDDYETLSRFAAELFVTQAQTACACNGRFSVALSGGATPWRTYEILSAKRYRAGVDWSRVHVFWGDERCVPSDDDRNNANMAVKTWLRHTPIPGDQIHAIDGTGDPLRGAHAYERTLREFFAGETTTFDFVFLGLGENGHTASLFPGSTVLRETEHWVAETFVAEQGLHRITLTAPVLNQSKLIVFLVSGESKGAVLREVLKGPFTPLQLPAQLIHPFSGKLLWLVDRPAAARLAAPVSSEASPF